MAVIEINSLDDPRVDVYRGVRDRELARDGDRFIAEGEMLVRRLLNSPFPTESVLLSDRRAREMAAQIPETIPVYVLPNNLVHELLGYKFHSGVMGCGRRLASPSLDLLASPAGRRTIVVCPEIANTENLGGLIRIAAAFSADAVLLGERCCDPFWRQSIRVSMGTVFSVPIIRSEDLQSDLRRLREEFGFELLASVLDESAEPLRGFVPKPRSAVLFGNEAQGLDAATLSQCDRKLTIPMKAGIDSLNVAIAAAVFLFQISK